MVRVGVHVRRCKLWQVLFPCALLAQTNVKMFASLNFLLHYRVFLKDLRISLTCGGIHAVVTH